MLVTSLSLFGRDSILYGTVSEGVGKGYLVCSYSFSWTSIRPSNSFIISGRSFSYIAMWLFAESRKVQHRPGGISNLFSSSHPFEQSWQQFFLDC